MVVMNARSEECAADADGDGCSAILMAFVPRDYLSLFKRQRMAANGAMVASLDENFATDCNWDRWAVVAHLCKSTSVQ
jgi:hypothetical protein